MLLCSGPATPSTSMHNLYLQPTAAATSFLDRPPGKIPAQAHDNSGTQTCQSLALAHPPTVATPDNETRAAGNDVSLKMISACNSTGTNATRPVSSRFTTAAVFPKSAQGASCCKPWYCSATAIAPPLPLPPLQAPPAHVSICHKLDVMVCFEGSADPQSIQSCRQLYVQLIMYTYCSHCKKRHNTLCMLMHGRQAPPTSAEPTGPATSKYVMMTQSIHPKA